MHMRMVLEFIILFYSIYFANGQVEDEITDALNLFNTYRRNVQPTASNMIKLQYDNDLATKAQGWAEMCNEAKPANLSSYGHTNYEVSYYATAFTLSLTKYIKELYQPSAALYTFSTNVCRTAASSVAKCPWYKQFVLAQAAKVGCGKKFCKMPNKWSEPMSVFVCLYDQQNSTDRPYTEGAPCSNCPSSHSACDNGLCSDQVATTTTTAITCKSTTTTTAPPGSCKCRGLSPEPRMPVFISAVFVVLIVSF